MTGFPARIPLGRSGLSVSKLGLGSSFKAPTSAYLEAFDRGVNYFYWGSVRRDAMGRATREIASDRRDQLVVMLQSYSRVAALLGSTVERGLRRLGVDHADLLLLGWFNKPPSPRVLAAARSLRARLLRTRAAWNSAARLLSLLSPKKIRMMIAPAKLQTPMPMYLIVLSTGGINSSRCERTKNGATRRFPSRVS